jgi:hypothetical protein
MNYLIKLCHQLEILRGEIDYHVLRASMGPDIPLLWISEVVRVRGAGTHPVY